MSKKSLFLLLHLLWYSLAGLIVFFAILVTTARLTTPLLNQHKLFFEQWASTALEAPVKIGYLQAYWEGFHPDLRLKEVSILDAKTHQEKLRMDRLEIDINLLKSLLHKELSPNYLIISGVSLSVEQTAPHQFVAKGFTDVANQTTGASIDESVLLQWIFSQPRLILKNCDIVLSLAKARNLDHIKIHQLSLVNAGDNHRFFGAFVWQTPTHQTPISVGVDWTGEWGNWQKTDALIYARIYNGYLSDFKRFGILSKGDFEGQGSGQIWLTWQQGAWQKVQSIFDLQSLQLTFPAFQKSFSLSALAGDLYFVAQPAGFDLILNHLKLATGDLVSSDNRIQVSLNHQQKTIEIADLDLRQLQKWMTQNQFLLSKKWRNYWVKLPAVSGHLLTNVLHYEGDWQNPTYYEFHTALSDVAFPPMKQVPGVKNLSGDLSIDNQSGHFVLSSTDLQLDFGSLFLEPLQWDVAHANMVWRRTENQGIDIQTNNIFVWNAAVTLTGEANLFLPADFKKPILQVLGGFDLNDTAQVKYYLPKGILSANAWDWLNQAFVGGDGASGTVILRGPIQDFPFDRHNGTFIVDADVRNTELHFAPDWPNAKNIAAKIIFAKRAMWSEATQGNIVGIPIQKMTATIPYMGEDKSIWVNLEGQAKTDASQLLNFISETPLRESIGEDLSILKMTGDTHLDLKINIPVEKPDQTRVTGVLHFDRVKTLIPTWNIVADKLTGDLTFTENSVTSEPLQVELWGRPMTLKFDTLTSLNHSPVTRLNMQGEIDWATLEKEFNWKVDALVDGDTTYHATLDLHMGKQDTRQNELSISSDLRGVSIQASPLIQKTKESALPFDFYFSFSGKEAPNALVVLGKKLSAALKFDLLNQQLRLFSLNVHLGDSHAALQEKPGLYIDGYLPTFDWQVWQTALQKIQSYFKTSDLLETRGETDIFNLRGIHLKVGQMTLWGQTMLDSVWAITPELNAWQVNIDSLRIAGTLRVPHAWQTELIKGQFKRLWLQPVPALTTTKDKLNPGHFPSMNLSLDSFQYGEKYHSAIQVLTKSQRNTLTIQRLHFDSTSLSGDLKGTWTLRSDNTYQSECSGSLSTDHYTDLMKSLNIHSSILLDQATASINLMWPEAIYNPVLKQMTGSIALDFGKGQIVNLSESSNAKLNMGRLLSLLDINRLLMLNFSDLTQKGYSFDEMHGEFQLKSGVISTDNLYFDGSIAYIAVQGVVDLMQEKLNLNLTITPYLTASLPIVATIVGGPIVGAVTWAANKLIGKQIDKLRRYYYVVTGTFQKPIVKEAKDVSNNAPLQSAS